MKRLIQNKARELGFDICRVTTGNAPATGLEFERWVGAGEHGEMGYLERTMGKRQDPNLVLPGVESIVCLGVSYFSNELEGLVPEEAGVVARYARYGDYHEALKARLGELCAFLKEAGGDGVRSLGYVDTGPVLERDLAQRAGVGFAGKHTNLISRELGNWFFLAEILTTLKLEPDGSERNRCGSCERCLEACPTGAITAPFHLDARRCISYLTIELKGPIPEEWRGAIGRRIFGCDDCLAVCPWNRFAKEGEMMRGLARADLGTLDLLELLRLDDEGFRARFAGTPMMRGKRRGLLRNVCVALGNTGDEKALPGLAAVMGDAEALIAEHAAWATKEIKRRHGLGS